MVRATRKDWTSSFPVGHTSVVTGRDALSLCSSSISRDEKNPYWLKNHFTQNKKPAHFWTGLNWLCICRAPSFDCWTYALLLSPAQSRQPYGTWKVPLNAASFRTWHGSWIFIAQDPNVNTTCKSQAIHSNSLGKEFSLARADCKWQGSAIPPPSTAFLSILNKYKKINHL